MQQTVSKNVCYKHLYICACHAQIYIFLHENAGNCFFLKDVSVYDNDSLGTVVYHGLVAGHNVGEGQQLACS